MTISNIPSSWVAPITHSLTTTGTGTGHATLASGVCRDVDTLNTSLDAYDVCDDEGTGYSSGSNLYTLALRASIDTHSDSGETFTVTLTDSSTPRNTVSFTMTINDPPVRIGVSLPDQEGVSRVGGNQPHEESTGSVVFDLSADEPLANDLTVCVRVSESGGNRVTSGRGIRTATLLASGVSNGSGSYTVNWTDTAADDPDSTVIVRVVPPEEAGCSATDGSYGVSGDDPLDTILIQDDEDTTVSLTSSDRTMTEGDASDTATLTVSLDRRLYGGETIGVPIALASTTGARLPGSVDGGSTANHDFTVAAAAGSGHSGVTLANASTANPRVVFTGHDSNTVQTATVTLTPVANRDDGDAAHETITATLSSLGLVDTTVSGGVAAHGTNNAATLTLADDEAAPPPVTCSAQNPIFNDTSLRILETGETTYCVRLTTAPSGGDTTVTIGRIGGGATVSPASLTFTSSNYETPQQVTVTGMDEPGSHRNRTTQLTHTASGGGYSSQNLGRVRVEVDDAPEVEAYWYIKGGAGGVRIRRPHTITSTPGLTPWQNAAPGDRISYAVRLSNRPEPGGTVTVMATVPSDKRNLVGLSLTKDRAAQDTVTVEFKDRSPGAGTGCSNWFGHQAHQYFDSHGNTRTVSGRQPSESYDGTADTPWECWRMIYVVRKDASRNIDDTCADITHTATGGGVRKVTVDTIRAHVRNPSRNRRGSSGYNTQCRNLTGNTQAAPATAAPAPTEAVANLQVTAVDDASASVTWDAVEHATSYDVSWSAESGDSLNASAGDLPGVTGTTTTIDHGASVPMTLTVTVTPEYVDKNGDTQQLDSLAGTATLAVGPGSDALSASAQSTDSQAPACVSDALLADARKAAGETWRTSPGHVERWSRVLAAFGESNAWSNNPMTIAEAQAQADRGLKRWAPVAPALECLEKEPAQAKAQVEAQQAVPAITVTAGAGVTEGTAAGFTLKADPAPAEELAVTVAVAQTGAIADASALGERIVTIPAGKAEAAFTVATLADETDEPAGAVTATVSDGPGYTVDDQGKSASVAVADDDATAVVLTAPDGDLPEASGSKTLTLTLGRALVEGESLSVPLALAGTATLGSDYTLAAPETAPAGVTYTHLGGTDPKNPPEVTFAGAAGRKSATAATLVLATVADSVAEGERETVTVKPGTPVATGLGGGAAASGAAGFAILEPPPEIAIAAKTGTVAEGADAAFTLTASRAPGADLTVNLTVSEPDGSDFVAAEHEGTTTATMPKGETEATFTVPTVNDVADEPGGTVTATLAGDGDKGLRYTVAAAPDNAASVKVTDDDAAATAPTFSVGDETANEDVGLMYFTVRLDRAVQQAVKVTFTAREASPVSARQGEDWFWWWPNGIALTFHPGQTEKRMWVYVYNDNHDEDPETFEVALSNPTGGTAIGDGVAVGTIVNNDPMPKAWLSRFGRTVAQQALDGIASRMRAPREAGVQGTLAGQALPDGSTASQETGSGPGWQTAAHDHAAPGARATGFTGGVQDGAEPGTASTWRALSLRELMLQSRFTATGGKDAKGGSLAFWGRAAQAHFDGREGTFSLDGDTTTGMLGADYARNRWMAGLALTHSEGEGAYADTDTAPEPCAEAGADHMSDDASKVLCEGAVREGDGSLDASLTAAIPYASFQATERLKLWGAAGYGAGAVTLKPEVGGVFKSDVSWTMAALGFRGNLWPPQKQRSGPALALESDALWARTSSEKTRDLAASDSDVTRLRLGLEGSWKIALDQNGHLTPRLEVGARHDGGDAETGTGIELGGGIAWSDPALGLRLDVEGRTLLAHGSDDLEDRGFAASLAYNPDPATTLGPSLTLRQDWGGQAKGGIDALFAPDPLDTRGGAGGTAESRWLAEAAYGFPVLDRRFAASPHLGFGFAAGTRDYSLGWRFNPLARNNAPDLQLGLNATRRDAAHSKPEHILRFKVALNW